MASDSLRADVQSLYIDHHSWLLGWLRRRMRDAGHASDLAQDTFLKVLVADCSTDIREPRPFLATIAQRLLTNHWRREELEKAYLDALQHQPEASWPSPETLSILMESLALVDRALSKLSTKARTAFLLAHLDGMTYAQIADELNVSTHSVKKYITQANMQCFFASPDFTTL